MHENYTSSPEIAILAGALSTMFLLLLYFIYLYFKTTGKLGNGSSIKLKMFLAGSMVIVYCFNGLFFLNGGHAKTEAVQKEFTSLHPILRLSISTILLVDRDLILGGMPGPDSAKHHLEGQILKLYTSGSTCSLACIIILFHEQNILRTWRTDCLPVWP